MILLTLKIGLKNWNFVAKVKIITTRDIDSFCQIDTWVVVCVRGRERAET